MFRISSSWQTLCQNFKSVAAGSIFGRIFCQNLSNWVQCSVVATSTVGIAETAYRTPTQSPRNFLKINFLSFSRKFKSFGPILNKLRQFEVLPPHTNRIQVWDEQQIILPHISHKFFIFVEMKLIFVLNCSLFLNLGYFPLDISLKIQE